MTHSFFPLSISYSAYTHTHTSTHKASIFSSRCCQLKFPPQFESSSISSHILLTLFLARVNSIFINLKNVKCTHFCMSLTAIEKKEDGRRKMQQKKYNLDLIKDGVCESETMAITRQSSVVGKCQGYPKVNMCSCTREEEENKKTLNDVYFKIRREKFTLRLHFSSPSLSFSLSLKEFLQTNFFFSFKTKRRKSFFLLLTDRQIQSFDCIWKIFGTSHPPSSLCHCRMNGNDCSAFLPYLHFFLCCFPRMTQNSARSFPMKILFCLYSSKTIKNRRERKFPSLLAHDRNSSSSAAMIMMME